jgi:hypothetical protein
MAAFAAFNGCPTAGRAAACAEVTVKAPPTKAVTAPNDSAIAMACSFFGII